MPWDDRHGSGYLAAVLRDGVRPFRYRVRVARLLGRPGPADAGMRSPPSVPFAEFRYEQPWLLVADGAARQPGAPRLGGPPPPSEHGRAPEGNPVAGRAGAPAGTEPTPEAGAGVRLVAAATGRAQEPVSSHAGPEGAHPATLTGAAEHGGGGSRVHAASVSPAPQRRPAHSPPQAAALPIPTAVTTPSATADPLPRTGTARRPAASPPPGLPTQPHAASAQPPSDRRVSPEIVPDAPAASDRRGTPPAGDQGSPVESVVLPHGRPIEVPMPRGPVASASCAGPEAANKPPDPIPTPTHAPSVHPPARLAPASPHERPPAPAASSHERPPAPAAPPAGVRRRPHADEPAGHVVGDTPSMEHVPSTFSGDGSPYPPQLRSRDARTGEDVLAAVRDAAVGSATRPPRTQPADEPAPPQPAPPAPPAPVVRISEPRTTPAYWARLHVGRVGLRGPR